MTESTSQHLQSEWEEIMAAAKDPAMFEPLYVRYFDKVYRFVFKRVLDEDLCGDITSTVFINAMQNIGKYSFKGFPFSAWLYRIAMNEVAQHYRRSSKQRIVSIDDQGIKTLTIEMSEGDSEMERNLERLKTTMQKLSKDEIDLLELRFFSKLAFAEVAEILDITENNAKVKTYRLLDKMRKLMGG